ncbi:MAG: hypothetical protein D3910_11220 [Candidatus Electrothrix sp. ATG2]|nr:hypothetical protein [Candidatus Electrothrix sp. ATG2]
MNKKIHKLKYLRIIFLFFTIEGSAVSLYSALSHYKNYTDPLYNSFSAISKAINCDTVAQKALGQSSLKYRSAGGVFSYMLDGRLSPPFFSC